MRSEIISAPEIMAPVNAVGEVEPLLGAGASWLYGGVLPEEWKERYPSTVLLNQRTFASAQFTSLEDLGEAVDTARRAGGLFALTLNAPYYMDEQQPAVLDLARRARDMGVDAFIAADPGLMSAMAEAGIKVPIHLSTMGIASNGAAVRMYRRLGVSRVILPRFLSAGQIARLVGEEPGVQYEAFVLVGKCPNIEGVCSFLHDSPDQRWPCEWRWELESTSSPGEPEPVAGHFNALERSDRRDGCGLCALPELVAAGVSAFKIVGRGAPVQRKVQLVSTLTRFLSSLPPQVDGEWIRRCREGYGDLYGHGCVLHNCYYPEIPGLW